MTYSRSGVLIFFMELGLFYLSQKKRSWKVFLGILVGALLVFLAVGVWGRFSVDRAVLNRLDIWRAGASLFAANPWWGGRAWQFRDAGDCISVAGRDYLSDVGKQPFDLAGGIWDMGGMDLVWCDCLRVDCGMAAAGSLGGICRNVCGSGVGECF